MAYTTINKSTDYFNTKLYTGTGSSNAQTGVGFQPDLLWIKKRNGNVNHLLHDAIRGVTKLLVSNSSAPEDTNTNILSSFNSDGFTVGTNSASNGNNDTFASWNWKANGAGSANTAGSINSTVSVNTTSGFSIVKYTANGTQGATVGHGLGVKPNVIIFKNLDSTLGDGEVDWAVYHSSLTATNFLKLNTTQAQINSDGTFNDTEPSNTLFTLGGGSQGDRFGTNRTGDNYIAYCFADVQGYSKSGSYIGNGQADGTFVYTGFKPAFILQKRTAIVGSWNLLDNKREGYNVDNNRLFPNTNDGDNTANIVDILSNGFKWKNTGSNYNNHGETNVYTAFAEAPLVGSNNVPCTAR